MILIYFIFYLIIKQNNYNCEYSSYNKYCSFYNTSIINTFITTNENDFCLDVITEYNCIISCYKQSYSKNDLKMLENNIQQNNISIFIPFDNKNICYPVPNKCIKQNGNCLRKSELPKLFILSFFFLLFLY